MTGSLETLALRVQVPGFAGTTLAREEAGLLEQGLGGVCLFGANAADGPEALGALTAAVNAARPDAVVAVDEEGGDVTRFHARTGSPALGHAALGVVDDLGLTERTAAMIGAELRELGVTLDLAPVADVNSNPANPVIGVRSFGADAARVARHVVAFVEGLRTAGVAACVKHFPGHGDTHEDSHVGLPRVEATEGLLANRELVPFAAAVAAGVPAVMTSHVLVPALDPHVPATLSVAVLRRLREELGFEGVVVSDALDMAGASAGRGVPAAAVAALRAGCDLLLLGPDKDASLVAEVRRAVVAAVREGELSEERLARAADRVAGLAALRQGTPEPGGSSSGPEEQVAAARRALAVDGALPGLVGALLTRVETPPTIAVGEVPWGVPGEAVDPDADGAADSLARAADGRPVVVQVRDLVRRPDVGRLVATLPGDVVLVEYGWPGEWADLPANVCARIRTHGASLPARAAVEALLVERGWRP